MGNGTCTHTADHRVVCVQVPRIFKVTIWHKSGDVSGNEPGHKCGNEVGDNKVVHLLGGQPRGK